MFALLGVFEWVSVSVFAWLLNSVLGGGLVKYAPNVTQNSLFRVI